MGVLCSCIFLHTCGVLVLDAGSCLVACEW